MKNYLFVLMTLLLLIPLPCQAKAKRKNWLFRGYNKIGVQLNAGVPDGAGADLVFRPLRFLRFNAGGTTDVFSGGIRAGVTVAPFYYVSPSLTFEGGYQFPGNANSLSARFGGSPSGLLSNVGYGYANLHGGLEFGHPNWFMFGIRGGYSYVGGETSGLQAYVNQHGSSVKLKDARVDIWTPSAKVNILIFF